MSVETLKTELAKYEAARDAILVGAQSYTINNQQITRANLDSIIKRIDVLQSRISACENNRGGGFKKVPVFER